MKKTYKIIINEINMKILKGFVWYFNGDSIQKDTIEYYDTNLELYMLKELGDFKSRNELFKTKSQLLKHI